MKDQWILVANASLARLFRRASCEPLPWRTESLAERSRREAREVALNNDLTGLGLAQIEARLPAFGVAAR